MKVKSVFLIAILLTTAFAPSPTPAGTRQMQAAVSPKAPQACLRAPAGLVSWWPGEGNAADLWGANGGTLKGGMSFSPGQVGQAFSLDGVDDWVGAPDSPSLHITNVTLEGWVNFRSLSGGIQHLFSKAFDTPLYRYVQSYGVWYNRNALQAGVASSAGDDELSFTWTPVLGQWYHIAYTFDDARNAAALYIDGVEVTSGIATASIEYDSHPFQIGADMNPGPTFYFSGTIDEVSLYNRALSADEIAAIYNAGSAGKCRPPIHVSSIQPLSRQRFRNYQVIGTTTIVARNGSPVAGATVSMHVALPDGTTVQRLGTTSATGQANPYVISMETGTYMFTVANVGAPGWVYDPSANQETSDSIVVGACIPPPGGLVSWWPGDGNANDIWGTNNGTLMNGAGFGPGMVGQAFSLDGTNDYVAVGDPESLKLTGPLTLEAWMNASASPPSGSLADVVSKWAYNSAIDSYLLGLKNVGGVLKVFGALHAVGSGNDSGFSGGVVALGTWYHIAMTYDPSTGSNLLYQDGQLVASRTLSGAVQTSDVAVVIGAEDSMMLRYFPGLIDEASLYSRALSADEIAAMYSAGRSGKCKP